MIYVILSYFCPLSKLKNIWAHTIYFYPFEMEEIEVLVPIIYRVSREFHSSIDSTNPILQFLIKKKGKKRRKKVLKDSLRLADKSEYTRDGRGKPGRELKQLKSVEISSKRFFSLYVNTKVRQTVETSWMKSNYVNGTLWVRTSSESRFGWKCDVINKVLSFTWYQLESLQDDERKKND